MGDGDDSPGITSIILKFVLFFMNCLVLVSGCGRAGVHGESRVLHELVHTVGWVGMAQSINELAGTRTDGPVIRIQ